MGKIEQETRGDEITFVDLKMERSTFPFKVKWGLCVIHLGSLTGKSTDDGGMVILKKL